jgi:hypothetical protein
VPQTREQVLEGKRRWQQAHPEAARLAAQRWRDAHPEQAKEVQRRFDATRVRDPEQRREYQRQWRALNRDKKNAYQREWDAAHPEAVKAKRKVKYEANKVRVQQEFAQSADLRLRALFAGAKSRAKREGIEFDLSFDDIVWPEFCPALGIRINYNLKGIRNRGDDSPSLDRTIPTLGYTKNNVAVISWRANRIKYNANAEELALLAEYVKRVWSN